MKKQAGIISVDFLIALIIVNVFCTVMFALCFTFTVVEISQYIAFSTSRAFIAGHISPQDQIRMGTNKYDQFLGSGGSAVLMPLFRNGWFELSKPDIRAGGETGQTFESEYAKTRSQSAYTGVRLQFNAKLLSLNFSILGSTSSDDQGFLANITGLLIREPSAEECQQQMTYDIRYRAILDLDRRFNNYQTTTDRYLPMEDNGC